MAEGHTRREKLLVGILVVLLVYMLAFAKAVLVPVFLAFLIYMGLRPVTRALERIVVALFSFDSVGHALLAPLIYFLVTFAEGDFITPMIFWGWIWGILGLFLAVPILMLASVLRETISPLPAVGRVMEAKRRASVLL